MPKSQRWFVSPKRRGKRAPAASQQEVVAERPLVLATDIARVLTDGSANVRWKLYDELEHRPHTLLIYVTEHSASWVATMRRRFSIPRADVVISDGGARLRTRRKRGALAPLQMELNARWPGTGIVRSRVLELDRFVKEVPNDEIAPTSIRYTVRSGFVPDDVLAKVRESLSELNLSVEFDQHGQIAVMPKVDDASVLLRALQWLDVEKHWVLLGGNLLESPVLQRSGFRGFVLGDANPKLKRIARERDDLYCARSTGANGVLEALSHFGYTEARPETLTITH